MNDLQFDFDKGKVVKYLVGSMGLAVASLFLMSIAESQDEYNPQFIQYVMACGVVFFGGGTLYIMTKLFSSRPGLIINDQGIVDNTSLNSAGLITWEQITNISASVLSGQKFMVIKVGNAEEFWLQKNIIKRSMMRLNQRIYKTPILISAVMLKCDFETMFEAIEKRLAQTQ